MEDPPVAFTIGLMMALLGIVLGAVLTVRVAGLNGIVGFASVILIFGGFLLMWLEVRG